MNDAPEDGGQLGHRLGRTQPVQAGQQRPLEGAGDLEVDQRGRQLPAGPPPHQAPRLEHGAAHLLDVERDAAGRRHDPVQHLARAAPARRRARSPAPDSSSSSGSRATVATATSAIPGRLELRTGGQEDEDRARRRPARAARWTASRVVGSHQWRSSIRRTSGRCAAEGDHPGHQRLDGPLEPELAAESTEPGRRDPEQRGDELVPVGHVHLGLAELRPDPGQTPSPGRRRRGGTARPPPDPRPAAARSSGCRGARAVSNHRGRRRPPGRGPGAPAGTCPPRALR